MKINDTRKEIGYRFGEIEQGCVFQFADMFYMKTELTKDHVNNLPCNAVLLENGEMVHFDSITDVTPLNCELTIK